MRDYAKISTSIWRSRKFRALHGDDRTRLLYLYLHTCAQVNSVGCFSLPQGYIATDLRWSEDTVAKAINTLSIGLLVEWNASEELVRIVDFIEHDPPTNPKHAAAMAKIAFGLPDSAEKLQVIKELSVQGQTSGTHEYAAEIERLSTGFRNPIETPNPNPVLVPTPTPLPSPSSLRSEGQGSPEIEALFETWWLAFPRYRRGAKGPVQKKWLSLVRRRAATPEQLIAGLERYNAAGYANSQFSCGAERWLNDERWTIETFAPPGDSEEARNAQAGTNRKRNLDPEQATEERRKAIFDSIANELGPGAEMAGGRSNGFGEHADVGAGASVGGDTEPDNGTGGAEPAGRSENLRGADGTADPVRSDLRPTGVGPEIGGEFLPRDTEGSATGPTNPGDRHDDPDAPLPRATEAGGDTLACGGGVAHSAQPVSGSAGDVTEIDLTIPDCLRRQRL